MSNETNHLNTDSKTTLAALCVNAFYSAMNLHVAQGGQLSEGVKDKLLNQVIDEVGTVSKMLRD